MTKFLEKVRGLSSAVCLLVFLGGCAAKVVSSGPRTVVISAGDARVQEAQNMADNECAKHGRFARMITRPSAISDQFLFDSVN